MLVLLYLIIKHFVIDALLQTKYQYSNKGTYGHPGGIVHATLHGMGTYIVFVVGWNNPAFFALLVVAIVDTIIHYHIDWTKVKFTKNLCGPSTDKHGKPCLCIYSNTYFVWIVADQCLHFATYLYLMYLMSVMSI